MNDSSYLNRVKERTIRWYENGNQDASCAAADIVHCIADAMRPTEIVEFCKTAPRPVVDAAAQLLARLKKEFDFLLPLYGVNLDGKSKNEIEDIQRARQAVYQEMYDLLCREIADRQ